MTGRIFHTLALAPPLLNCRSSLRFQSRMTLLYHESIPDPGCSHLLFFKLCLKANRHSKCLVSSLDKCFSLGLLLTVNHWQYIPIGRSWICIFRKSKTEQNLILNSLPTQTLTLLTKDMRSSLGPEIRYIFPLQAKQWVIKHGVDSFCS